MTVVNVGAVPDISSIAPIDNINGLNMADVVKQAGEMTVASNDSYVFLNSLGGHLNNVSSADLAHIQTTVEEFSIATQFVAKTVSTCVKDVDGLVRMQ